MKPNKPALLLLSVAFAASLVLYLRTKERRERATKEPLAMSTAVTPSPTPSETAAPPPQARQQKSSPWESFEQRFGTQLQAKQTPNGYIESIRGKLGQGQKVKKFDPTDSKKVIERGKEIISEAEELLGVRPEFPLGPPVVQGSAASAQLTFQQTYQGLNVMPQGTVEMILGPEGELVGLYSAYIPDLKILNKNSLTLEEAQARTGLPDGTAIVWVLPNSDGYLAYSFMSEGIQTVIDAETGKTLAQKNRRRH